jgi:hypothetical protein
MGASNPLDMLRSAAAHATNAPPPKLKKDRKKEEAANAIDRPEDDLDEAPETAGSLAKGERQAGRDDDDHGDDLGNRPLAPIPAPAERLLPGIPEPAAWPATQASPQPAARRR